MCAHVRQTDVKHWRNSKRNVVFFKPILQTHFEKQYELVNKMLPKEPTYDQELVPREDDPAIFENISF